jgi:hypothetical protein
VSERRSGEETHALTRAKKAQGGKRDFVILQGDNSHVDEWVTSEPAVREIISSHNFHLYVIQGRFHRKQITGKVRNQLGVI